MYYDDLLERLQSKEPEAFLELTDRYGWAVYSAIREQHSDPDLADKIYNETMNVFCNSLSKSESVDPVEAILCALAGMISPDKLCFDQPCLHNTDAPPEITLENKPFSETDSGTGAGKKRFRYRLGNTMILLAIAAVLWYIAALLVELGLIPYVDLGYTWFCSYIASFFSIS